MESSTCSPLFELPGIASKIGTLAGTLYFARNAVAVIRRVTSTRPLAGISGSRRFAWVVGKLNVIPLVNCQVSDGFAGSYSETSAPVMFFSSMNSSPVPAGSYMSSLMTTGPTAGAALADPNVGADSATKSVVPSLAMWRPNGTPTSAAEKDCESV